MSFNVMVSPPESAAVDMYLLLDLSYTMSPNLRMLQSLAIDLGMNIFVMVTGHSLWVFNRIIMIFISGMQTPSIDGTLLVHDSNSLMTKGDECVH